MPIHQHLRRVARGAYNAGRRFYQRMRGPATRANVRFRNAVYNRVINTAAAGAVGTGGYVGKRVFRSVSAPRRSVVKRRKIGGRGLSGTLVKDVRRIMKNDLPVGHYQKLHVEEVRPVADNHWRILEKVAFENDEFWDTASVLWNNKPAEWDISPTTENIEGYFNYYLKSAGVSWSVTNTGTFDLHLIIRTFTTKQNSDQSPMQRWQSGINLLNEGNPVGYEDPHVSLSIGSKEVLKYFSVSTKRMVLRPGQKKNVCNFSLKDYVYKRENFFENNQNIRFKRGVTKTFTIQHVPQIMHNTSLGEVGYSDYYQHPYVLETNKWFKVNAPDVTSNAENVDKYIRQSNYSTQIDSPTFPRYQGTNLVTL